jgi:hypothetical protein
MVIWTVPQRDTTEAPTFSLTGALVCWPDGAAALVKQTPFQWQDGAWHAAVEVERAGCDARYAFGTIRLEPAVAAAWQRRRVNPRREATEQLRSALQVNSSKEPNLGLVTFSPA